MSFGLGYIEVAKEKLPLNKFLQKILTKLTSNRYGSDLIFSKKAEIQDNNSKVTLELTIFVNYIPTKLNQLTLGSITKCVSNH